MKLGKLLEEYRGYELQCIHSKTTPKSFRVWVHKEHSFPSMTMEGLVQALVTFEEIYDMQDEFDDYTEAYDDLTRLTREII